MNEVTLIGIDMGKHGFHLHAQHAKGHDVFRKRLAHLQLLLFFSNPKRITIVKEACAGSHWLAIKLNDGARCQAGFTAIGAAFREGHRNDCIDAEAIEKPRPGPRCAPLNLAPRHSDFRSVRQGVEGLIANARPPSTPRPTTARSARRSNCLSSTSSHRGTRNGCHRGRVQNCPVL